jgi:hypothetical protein
VKIMLMGPVKFPLMGCPGIVEDLSILKGAGGENPSILRPTQTTQAMHFSMEDLLMVVFVVIAVSSVLGFLG